MTAFGGIFRGPSIEGVDESDGGGERGRIVGLDLESGVVRVRPARPAPPEPAADDTRDDSADDRTGD
jgi:hypothetical protein